MKIYFIVIIVVLVMVIGLLFFLLFKIYNLHMRSEEGSPSEQISLNSGSFQDKSSDKSEKSSISSDRESSQMDLLDGKVVSAVQPDVKNLVGPTHTPNIFRKMNNGVNSKVTLSIGYSLERTALKVAVLEACFLPKGKPGSSESYIDLQISPHRHRTYRNPGHRRPLRGILNKPIEFRLEKQDICAYYLFAFFLRYDPFSRIKIDGEICIRLSDLDQDTLDSGEPIVIRRDLEESHQEFTAFIFRLR